MNEFINQYGVAIGTAIFIAVMARITYYKCVIDKLTQKLKMYGNNRNKK